MRKIKARKATIESLAVSIEDLAIITAKGFESVDKRFAEVDKRFAEVDKRFDRLETKMVSLGENQLDLKLRFDVFDKRQILEIENLKRRVGVLERKVGVHQ